MEHALIVFEAAREKFLEWGIDVFFSLTPFSAMSIWSPKGFVVGGLLLYWSVSRFARKSRAKSKNKSRGETGDVWRGCVQVQKIAQEGGIPHPQLCEAANLRKTGFWQKRSGPRG